jgi:CheY-like chemotaxis protein
MKMAHPPQIVLLVEDDANDAFLAQRALHESGAFHHVIHLPDGEEAIKYLNGDPPYNDRNSYPIPGLILLDLKMPKLTGFDVLTWLQRNPQLTSEIPVIVLTGSIHPEDVKRAQELGAVGFEIKPVEFSKLIDIAKKISQSPRPAKRLS